MMRPSTGERFVRIPILFRAFSVLILAQAGFPNLSWAQVVRGHLHDSETRGPVINGTVALRNALGTVVARAATDEEGAYELTARNPGTHTLLAVGLGYRSTPTEPFQLAKDQIVTIDISLSPQPLELDPLSVEARRQRMVAKLTHHGFYERQRQGFGSFLTPEQIKQWPAISVVDILVHAPFVYRTEKRRPGQNTGIIIRRYGACSPAVYIDGNRLQPGWDIEDAVSPETVVAVEVFRGTTQIPLQWAQFETCGVILIWTDLGGIG